MIKEKKVTAILLVAGNSTRYGQNRNKNFDKIEGKPVINYSLEAFEKNPYIDCIIIGAKKEEICIIEEILKKQSLQKEVNIVLGGASRQQTVYQCLKKAESDIVIIHDGARPLIKQEYINKCIEAMKEYKGVTIGVPSKDTIKLTDENGIITSTTKRNNTWIVQTPQCFEKSTLLQMHEKYQTEEVTDDCMLMEKSNHKIKILKGDYTNIKITTYEDIKIIQSYIKLKK